MCRPWHDVAVYTGVLRLTGKDLNPWGARAHVINIAACAAAADAKPISDGDGDGGGFSNFCAERFGRDQAASLPSTELAPRARARAQARAEWLSLTESQKVAYHHRNPKDQQGKDGVHTSGAALANGVRAYLDTADWERARIDYNYEIPPPTLLPPRAALAACPALITFARNAIKGWGPARHWLFHGGVRGCVVVTLLVAQRLKTGAIAQHASDDDAPFEESAGVGVGGTVGAADGPAGEAAGASLLQTLPPEMWLAIMAFFLRTDWAVPVSATARAVDKDPEEVEEDEDEEDEWAMREEAMRPKELIHMGY